MVNIQTWEGGSYAYWPAFNVDGKYLYGTAGIYLGNYAVLPIDLSTNTPGNAIPIMGYNSTNYGQSLAGGLDPQTGTPVMNVPWTDGLDLHLSVIDTFSGSKTFNTILRTFDAGINDQNYNLFVDLMTASPDGKFAYVWYDDYDYNNTGRDVYFLGIFNLTTGAFTSISADSLGVFSYQYQVYVTPDSKSLLLATYSGYRAGIRVFNLSNPTHPKRVTDLTPIPVPGRGFPYVFNYQVVEGQLYAIDSSGIAVVFNFDSQKGDFRERGYSIFQGSNAYYGGLAFSPDGLYMYGTDYLHDQVSVFDTSKLAVGKSSLITNIRAPYYPYGITVSPAAPPSRQRMSPRDTQSPLRRTNMTPRGIASE